MLELIDETEQWQTLSNSSLADLEQPLNTYFGELGLTQSVTLILCDDVLIRELNVAHRQLDETTDVLSYPMQEPDDVNMPMVEHLGDVFISLDTAKRQAPEHNHSLLEEVLTLAAHGVTHLRGFDHPTEEAWHPFHEAQKRVLSILGDP